VNRRQRKRLHDRRTFSGPPAPTPITMALNAIHAKAKRESVQATQQYLDKNMTFAGFLPKGDGGWREMTPVERVRWLGKDA
jgi:hypothetical protein